MQTYVMLTRVSADASTSPRSLENLEQDVMGQLRTQCPEVEWVHNYAILGPYDYLDIFNAPDIETATKVSTLVRTFGHAHSEVWPVTEWSKYKNMLHSLPDKAA